MSIINQMLKDLSRREVPEAVPGTHLGGLITARTHPSFRSFVVLTASIFTTAVLLAGGWLHFRVETVFSSHSNSAIMRTDFTEGNPSPVPDMAKLSTPPAALTGITLRIEKGMTYLDLLLSQNALYRVMGDARQNKITLVLERAKLVASVPVLNYENSAIKNIQMLNDKEDNLKIIIWLNSGADLKRLLMDEHAKLPALQMDFSYKNDLISPGLQEKMVPAKSMVVDFGLDEWYRHAMNLSVEGRRNEAVILLREILDKSAEFAEARESLAILLMKQGKLAEASAVINQGLRQKPDYLPYLQLKAHLLFNQGHALSALRVLRTVDPPLDASRDYYAFVAAIYQHLGQFTAAQRIYEQLIRSERDNGAYWVGLGISLEKSGKTAQAKEAFLTAEQTGNLSPELKRYLDSRG